MAAWCIVHGDSLRALPHVNQMAGRIHAKEHVVEAQSSDGTIIEVAQHAHHQIGRLQRAGQLKCVSYSLPLGKQLRPV